MAVAGIVRRMKSVPGTSHFDVIVLGAGAAGLFCAGLAGQRGRRVLLLEHGDRPGRKILISGGGRCNFTNLRTRPENYLSDNPHFAKSALARYTPQDFLALVERHQIRYHEKTLGQLFCDDSARQILTLLEQECAAGNVQVRTSVALGAVRQLTAAPGAASSPRWEVETSAGLCTAHSIVVATGALSIPKLGATAFGYELARQFGHAIVEPRAGLVPLVFSPEDRDRWCDLTGLSCEVLARAAPVSLRSRTPTPEFREKLLITHRGLSGPAVLQASSFWRPGGTVSIDLAPGRELLAPMLDSRSRRDPATLLQLLRAVLPSRLAERWVELHTAQPDGNGEGRPDWTNAGIARLEDLLHRWEIRPAGTEGFVKAEVTVGGVDTRELDARSMQSRRAAGLYFVGEVVDVTGWLGGYNFQWAWASAAAAAEFV